MSASFGYEDKMMGAEVELWVGSMSLLFIIGWKALCIDCVDCACLVLGSRFVRLGVTVGCIWGSSATKSNLKTRGRGGLRLRGRGG